MEDKEKMIEQMLLDESRGLLPKGYTERMEKLIS